MAASIFLDFDLPNATSWFYLSLLLAVALFFKFSRFGDAGEYSQHRVGIADVKNQKHGLAFSYRSISFVALSTQPRRGTRLAQC